MYAGVTLCTLAYFICMMLALFKLRIVKSTLLLNGHDDNEKKKLTYVPSYP